MVHNGGMAPNLIAALRLLRVALHLGYGLAVVSWVYPALDRQSRLRLKRRWSRQLLAIFGVRLCVAGADGRAGMRVANHVSWLDVFVINAMEPVSFVAKDDVARWPLLGLLAQRTDTIFMARANARASRAAGARVAAALADGHNVAVFPEGTTTEGDVVLPFRSALFEGATDAGAEVQPLFIQYLDRHGRRSTAPAYCGDTSLLESLWRLATTPRIDARVTCLSPVATQGRQRRELAAYCQFMVASALFLAQSDESVEHRNPGLAGPVAALAGGDAFAQGGDETVMDVFPVQACHGARSLRAHP